MTVSIAIVGGGIVGLSTAFYLAKQSPYQISLFDWDKGQASRASGGIIAPWLSQRRNQDWYALVKEAAAFYPRFIQDLGEEVDASKLYQRKGALIFKKNRKTLENLYQLAQERKQDAPEMGQIDLIDADQIKQLVPIYDQSSSAIYVQGGARADGKALVERLIDLFQALGGQFIHQDVDVLNINESSFELTSGDQSFHFDQVVLANGAWVGELLRPLEFEVDTGPQKGQLAEIFLEGMDSGDWPVMMPAGGNNIIPFEGGRILIGATHEKEEGFKTDLIPSRVQPLLEDAADQVSQKFLDYDQISYRVGIRAYSSDFSPYFGQIDGVKGLYTANGLGATGLTAGPLVGYMLAALIQDHPLPLPLAPYQPSNYISK